ncbi:unnamed protein product [Eruca vesicaria subsp. sativa]|uniref:Uncharacterized protein n=1 Tax=Eruca vesicaria subsp. sativa TaxID=29727 RepID=A0ABC8L874_ERUVS|nr:unnamed protein product [Eruca vesicaria subsp. sativa]
MGQTPKKVVLGCVKTLKKKKKQSVAMVSVGNSDDVNREVNDDNFGEKSLTNVGVEFERVETLFVAFVFPGGEDVRDTESFGVGGSRDRLVDGKTVEGSVSFPEDGETVVRGVEEAVVDNSGGGSLLEGTEGKAAFEEKEGLDLKAEDSLSEQPEEVLVALKEGDGVPKQWVEEGVTGYRGAGSNSVGNEQVSGSRSDVEGSNGGKSIERSVDDELVGLDKLVGALVKEHGSDFGEVNVGEVIVRVSELNDAAGGGTSGGGRTLEDEVFVDGVLKEKEEVDVGEKVGGEENSVGDVLTEKSNISGKEMVTYLSDSSPCPRSEKHKPIELEAGLAALLLAKAPYSLGQIVPAAEDVDFGYFEQVLLSNPKVLHLGAGNFDLDNQFFLDLITPRKWVSSKYFNPWRQYVG